MEDLPDSYDLIIVGTGMPECMIAAAASRVGKSVLHLDRNSYYGGDWASFNFEQLLSWVEEHQVPSYNSPPSSRLMEVSWLEQLNDDERLVLCPKRYSTVSNVIQHTYAREKLPEPVVEETNSEHAAGNSETEQRNETTENVPSDSENIPEHGSSEEHVENSQECQVSESVPLLSAGNNIEVPERSEVPEERGSGEVANVPSSSSDQFGAGSSSSENVQSAHQSTKEWTMNDLMENRRKFNIDLSPKLLFSRGSLVELLISSNIARYAEFQSVGRILTHINGHLEQVPCSRADVFSTKSVSVVEKRMLMKLLTFCMEFQNHPEEYRGFEGRPFIEFLRSRKVSSNIEHYVLHAIAMVSETCSTLQGLKSTQRFMESLGRYGNSPFLWTCYGSAELPQCFCRLCAVFGGIYYLKRDVDAVILDRNNHCAGVVSRGRKLKCCSVVMEYSYAPLDYLPDQQQLEMVSHAVYITDCSILPAERQQNTFLRIPPVVGVHNAISILEVGSLSFICPDKLFLVHMFCKSFGESVEEEFKSAEKQLFNSSNCEEDEEATKDNEGAIKPKVLWCLYYRQRDMTSLDVNAKCPRGVFLTSSVNAELDYEQAVKQAREIFEKLYPGEEFLPHAPDPEDIIMDEHSNPGTEAENHTEENSNIENDVKTESVAEEEVNAVQQDVTESSLETTSHVEKSEITSDSA